MLLNIKNGRKLICLVAYSDFAKQNITHTVISTFLTVLQKSNHTWSDSNNPSFPYIKTISSFSLLWPRFPDHPPLTCYLWTLSYKTSTSISSSLTCLPRLSQTDLTPSSSEFPKNCAHVMHYGISSMILFACSTTTRFKVTSKPSLQPSAT